MIGQTISHYKILEKLGEGGMGVVYKAEDTKLDRMVALKFMPEHLAASEQDKERFRQEAKATAALNHPNVCSIIDIQQHEEQLFIVMEFVDGQTLREKGGSISFKQAVDIGIQIADGLAAAHEKGIVHRDIKPENIMIRKDGIAQIMDFGLAKLRSASSKINRLTKEGSTVGTAGYMSPEQVLGQDADHRSDIFSFGVLLYELFTGQLPFRGVHETALAYEIVNVDAAPLSSIKPELDPTLDAIVLDCLEKDPKERCQSVAEVARDLRRVKRESTRQRHSRITAARPVLQESRSSSVVDREGGGPSTISGPARKRIPIWLQLGLVALVMTGVGYGIAMLKTSENPVLPVIRATIEMPRGVQYNDGIGGHSVLSPDGSTIAFVASDSFSHNGLWVRTMHADDAKPLAGTDNAQYPFWSPDSRTIGFFADGKLKTIDAGGGPVLVLADAPFGRGAVWSTAGQILFSPNVSDRNLYSVPSTGGAVLQVASFDTSLHSVPRFPDMLPDGKHVVVSVLNVVSNASDVYLTSLDGGSPTRLLADGSYARYAAGYLFFLRQGILMVQRFDTSSNTLVDAPKPVQDHVNSWVPRAKADYSVTEGGLLLFSTAGRTKTSDLLWLSKDGTEEIIGKFDVYRTIDVSPDETRIAYDVNDPKTGLGNIWIYNIVTNVQAQLTLGNGRFGSTPRWSKDGKTIFFNREVGANKANIYAKNADGSGTEELIARGEEGTTVGFYPQDTSPDGHYLLVVMRNESGGELGVVDLTDMKRPVAIQKLGTRCSSAGFSPDGRWIVYQTVESGSSRISVCSFRGQSGIWQVAADATSRLWKDDKIVYWSRARDRYEAVTVSLASGSPVFGPAQPLFMNGKYQSVFIFGASSDGKRFLAYRPENAGGGGNLSLLVNWKKYLESK